MGIVGRWLSLLVLVVSGCRTAPPDLQPPPPPPDFSLPPETDGRYNKPYQPSRDPFSTTPGKRLVQPTTPAMIPNRPPGSGFTPGGNY
ncbi:MAG: hypothetical protein L0Z62_34250 [Gemmataceae bacterium]|nr:hypothetical protein [Gemmataceae bacterium]